MIEPRTVRQIANYIEGVIVGNGDHLIRGVSTVQQADDDDLVFIESSRHLDQIRRAGAVLIPRHVPLPPGLTAIVVGDPAGSMARVVDWMWPSRRSVIGVSTAAHVEASARLGRDVGVAPLAYVGANAQIGDRTEVHPSATIGADAVIGADCIIHSGVHIYPQMMIGNRVILHSGVVIGADGFGYTRDIAPDQALPADEPYRHRKTRHIGVVVIEDDVEIGANTTIDRATLSATVIGRGTKIDNLVTIGHNSRVGRHCIIIGQAGLSGSTTLGDYVTVAGQAGLTGHIRIGDHAVVGAQSGVTKDVPPRGVVLGSPAVDGMRAKKALTLIDSLPEFKRTLAAHERRLTTLEGGST